MLGFNDYQKQAWELAQYPQSGKNLVYPALGLVGESGEVAEKVKKLWRNQGIMSAGLASEDFKTELIKEISDVLWYAAALASELDTDLEHVAQVNLDKLNSRQLRGVIKSEGDNR